MPGDGVSLMTVEMIERNFLNLDGEIGLHLFGIFSLDQLNQIRIGYQGSINGEEPKGFVEGLCE